MERKAKKYYLDAVVELSVWEGVRTAPPINPVGFMKFKIAGI